MQISLGTAALVLLTRITVAIPLAANTTVNGTLETVEYNIRRCGARTDDVRKALDFARNDAYTTVLRGSSVWPNMLPAYRSMFKANDRTTFTRVTNELESLSKFHVASQHHQNVWFTCVDPHHELMEYCRNPRVPMFIRPSLVHHNTAIAAFCPNFFDLPTTADHRTDASCPRVTPDWNMFARPSSRPLFSPNQAATVLYHVLFTRFWDQHREPGYNEMLMALNAAADRSPAAALDSPYNFFFYIQLVLFRCTQFPRRFVADDMNSTITSPFNSTTDGEDVSSQV